MICMNCGEPIESDGEARIWYHTGTQYAECAEVNGPRATPDGSQPHEIDIDSFLGRG